MQHPVLVAFLASIAAITVGLAASFLPERRHP